MNDDWKEKLETNFRLSLLYTRKVAEDIGQQCEGMSHQMGDLSQRMDDMGQRMDTMSQRMEDMSQQMGSMGRQMSETSQRLGGASRGQATLAASVRAGFEEIAKSQEEVFRVLYGLGDSSVDLRKEISDLKERVRRLEDRAS